MFTYDVCLFNVHSIGDSGATHIGSMMKMNRALTSIDLRGNDIGLQGITALFEALFESNRTVTSLDLAGSSGNRNRIGSKGAQAISETLQQNRVLSRLSLRESGLGIAGIQQLSEGLHNTCLTYLDLGYNNLAEEGCAILAHALKFSDIETLLVPQNAIGNEGAAAIAQLAKSKGGITHLDLSNNAIGLPGVKKLAGALKVGYSLRILQLSGNHLTTNALKILFDPLLQDSSPNAPCPPLVLLDFSCNELDGDSGDLLTLILNKLSVLKRLNLSENKLGGICTMILTHSI